MKMFSKYILNSHMCFLMHSRQFAKRSFDISKVFQVWFIGKKLMRDSHNKTYSIFWPTKCLGHLCWLPRPCDFSTHKSSGLYHVAENFQGRYFCEFRGFVAIHESFLHEIWGMASFGVAKASNPQKFSQRKSYFFTNSRKFTAIRYIMCSTCTILSYLLW